MKPVLTSKTTIAGIETEIVLQNYADRTLVLVTQLGKVGCLIQATIPQTTPLPPLSPPSQSDTSSPASEPPQFPPPPPSISLTPLIGHPPSPSLHPIYNFIVSQLATLIWCVEERGGALDRRGVIVGLALKLKSTGNQEDGDNEGANEVFRGVAGAVLAMLENDGAVTG